MSDVLLIAAAMARRSKQENTAQINALKAEIDRSIELRLQESRRLELRGEQGPQGETGPIGPAGKDGVDGKDGSPGLHGKDGLDGRDGARGERGERGEMGPPGKAGPQGPKGDPGPRGQKGDKGDRGEPGKAPDHEVRGQRVRFKRPDGTWGKWIDVGHSYGPVYAAQTPSDPSRNAPAGSSTNLAELESDPINPELGRQWILRSVYVSHEAAGVLLGGFRMGRPVILQKELPEIGIFDLSVSTSEGIKRVRLQ